MINELAKEIYEANKKKGFWDKERNVGELLMLVTSELGEAMEAHRKSNFSKIGKFIGFHNYGFQKSYEEFIKTEAIPSFEENVKDTFEDEIADAIIRLFDLSAGLGIDIDKHIEAKLKYNLSRPKLHGKAY